MFEQDHPVEARILALIEVKMNNQIVLDEELYTVFEWFFGNKYSRNYFDKALLWLDEHSLINYNQPALRTPTKIQVTQIGKILTEESSLSSIFGD